MPRTVGYKIVERGNPGRPDEHKKFYALIKCTRVVDVDELGEQISGESTASEADVVAVITALQRRVCQSLSNGEIVRLGTLGSLRISLRSEGARTEKDFNASLMRKAHVIFTPGKAIKDTLNNLVYSKITAAEPDEPEEEVPANGSL